MTLTHLVEVVGANLEGLMLMVGKMETVKSSSPLASGAEAEVGVVVAEEGLADTVRRLMVREVGLVGKGVGGSALEMERRMGREGEVEGLGGVVVEGSGIVMLRPTEMMRREREEEGGLGASEGGVVEGGVLTGEEMTRVMGSFVVVGEEMMGMERLVSILHLFSVTCFYVN